MADDTAIIDMNNAKHAEMLIGWVKSLRGKGLHRVSIKRVRAQRSLKANSYYWACILPAVQAGIEEAWGERYSVEDIHMLMRKMFLMKTIVNRKTGEVIDEIPASTTEQDTQQFGDYLDKIIKWAGEWLHVEVPTPEEVTAR